MFSKMSMPRKVFIVFLVILVLSTICDCRRLKNKKVSRTKPQRKQFQPAELRETNPPNFVRLVIMRLIYGIATQMGLEERLAGVFNGVFVPPSAEDDDYSLIDFGGDDDFGGGDLFDL